MHLAIDGYGGDESKMWDEEFVRRFLADYPSSLDMNVIHGPSVLSYHAPDPRDSGVTGFVIIAESHISVHTFPNRQYVNVDVFSCKSFDDRKALADVKEYFDLREVRTWVMDRGLEHLERLPPD